MLSPCLDAGSLQTWMTGAMDLDGRERIIGEAVDMGAYETPPPAGTVIVVH